VEEDVRVVLDYEIVALTLTFRRRRVASPGARRHVLWKVNDPTPRHHLEGQLWSQPAENRQRRRRGYRHVVVVSGGMTWREGEGALSVAARPFGAPACRKRLRFGLAPEQEFGTNP